MLLGKFWTVDTHGTIRDAPKKLPNCKIHVRDIHTLVHTQLSALSFDTQRAIQRERHQVLVAIVTAGNTGDRDVDEYQ